MLLAPELQVSEWLNTSDPLSLAKLRGKVVVLHSFQMLCPGCVLHAIPQLKMLQELCSHEALQIIGLHTVFEHHEVMQADALKAFVHEYKLTFPIAIDRPSLNSPIPCTMKTYQLQGTPSLVLIDRRGYIRCQHFGRLHDMQLGKIVGQLLEEEQSINANVVDDVRGKKKKMEHAANTLSCGAAQGCDIKA